MSRSAFRCVTPLWKETAYMHFHCKDGLVCRFRLNGQTKEICSCSVPEPSCDRNMSLRTAGVTVRVERSVKGARPVLTLVQAGVVAVVGCLQQ